MKLIFCATSITVILLMACRVVKPPVQISQGISGYIYEVRGNQMPSPGRPVSKGRGVVRDIYIYEPTTLAQTEGVSPLFSHIKTKLFAHTKSDSTGYYSINLPSGNYSIFVAEGPNFFAATTNTNGQLNPISVTVKNITKNDIAITINAVY